MVWWQWLAVGLVLVALEMTAAGGFYVIFFGIAAIVIAALQVAGLAGPAWVQLLLFSAISVVSLLVFRHRLLKRWQIEGGGAEVDSLVGGTAVALEEMAAGAVGRVELRGDDVERAEQHGQPDPEGAALHGDPQGSADVVRSA